MTLSSLLENQSGEDPASPCQPLSAPVGCLVRAADGTVCRAQANSKHRLCQSTSVGNQSRVASFARRRSTIVAIQIGSENYVCCEAFQREKDRGNVSGVLFCHRRATDNGLCANSCPSAASARNGSCRREQQRHLGVSKDLFRINVPERTVFGSLAVLLPSRYHPTLLPHIMPSHKLRRSDKCRGDR